MKVRDFVHRMGQQWPAVDISTTGRTGDGMTPGAIRTIAIWNALAILFPDKCEDFVYWGSNAQTQTIEKPEVLRNPLADPALAKAENPFEIVWEEWKQAQHDQAVNASRPEPQAEAGPPATPDVDVKVPKRKKAEVAPAEPQAEAGPPEPQRIPHDESIPE